MTDDEKARQLLDEIERELGRQKKLDAQIESLAARRRQTEARLSELKQQLAEVYTLPLKLE